MMHTQTVVTLGLFASAAVAQAPDLSFKAGQAGEFTFDTGTYAGRLVVGEKSQGLVSLIDKATGTGLTKGQPNYGIFSFYRLLSPKQRWGGVIWEWPKTARLLPDGGLRIDWPAADDHPAHISATFRWTSPDTLDLEAGIQPERDMPKLELFIGSYFKDGARGKVYLAAPRHAPGKPELLPVDVTFMTLGTFLAFPRDLEAAQLVYDGRWEQGLHPVQWSISRYLGAPLAMRRDDKTGLTVMLMSRADDCSCVYCSYDKDPPDGVAGHFSTYLSLFGGDLKKGGTAHARARLVIRQDVTSADAINVYEQFVKAPNK